VVEPDLALRGRARAGVIAADIARLRGGISMVTRFVTLALLAALFLPIAPVHAAQAPQPAQDAGDASRGAVVNLNTASAAQLESLPGVGAKTAQRILDYRQKSGGFKKIEELMNVKGIGEKSFLKLKPHITVGAPKA
jgi:competence protein ComEA